MLIQIHMLQNYAPSNLNRDDTGSPKDAVFGGVRRGRISSQCLKRSMRTSEIFATAFQEDNLLGSRTKRLPKLVSDALAAMGIDDAVRENIVARVPEIGQESTKRSEKKVDPEKAETRQLIFIGGDEVDKIAQHLLRVYEENGPKKWEKLKIDEITGALEGELPRSVDIAMFGRMTTSAAFEDVQAAVQVAHALSANALTQEFDYFTAVDDLSGESGAGMIGDVEFNSSTYYKYLNVHWDELVQNLGGDEEVAARAVLALVEAAALAQPSGKQNSFAAFNLPDFVLIEVGDNNLPVSYANAFLKPVYQTHNASLIDNAISQLSDYMGRLRSAYDLDGRRAYLALNGAEIDRVQRVADLNELKAWLASAIQEAAHA